MTYKRLKELESLVKNRLYVYNYRRYQPEVENYETLDVEDEKDLLSLIIAEKRKIQNNGGEEEQ